MRHPAVLAHTYRVLSFPCAATRVFCCVPLRHLHTGQRLQVPALHLLPGVLASALTQFPERSHARGAAPEQCPRSRCSCRLDATPAADKLVPAPGDSSGVPGAAGRRWRPWRAGRLEAAVVGEVPETGEPIEAGADAEATKAGRTGRAGETGETTEAASSAPPSPQPGRCLCPRQTRTPTACGRGPGPQAGKSTTRTAAPECPACSGEGPRAGSDRNPAKGIPPAHSGTAGTRAPVMSLERPSQVFVLDGRAPGTAASLCRLKSKQGAQSQDTHTAPQSGRPSADSPKETGKQSYNHRNSANNLNEQGRGSRPRASERKAARWDRALAP